MRILVTGAAGFIGFHLTKRLCELGHDIIGIDNLNDYYDVSLKHARLGQLEPFDGFTFKKIDIADREAMEKLFRDHEFDRVVHLAAQAGVRYSLDNPHAYIQSNVVGFMNVLEGCRQQWCSFGSRFTVHGSRNSGHSSRHLVFASSSSVYGLNTSMPFSVHDNVDHPISIYGASKRADELMAHAYSHLYGIPTTGLRFFTVYGPWGRPDMAYFKFTRAIERGETIDVYNEGKMERDFTYIDDIVEGIVRVTNKIPSPLAGEGQGEGDGSRLTGHGSRSGSTAPYRLYNIGNHSPVKLMDFITAIEKALGKEAKKTFLPMQPGDVAATYADIDDLARDVGFEPNTSIQDGIRKFVEWYRSYYGKVKQVKHGEAR